MYIRIVNQSGKILVDTFEAGRLPGTGEIIENKWVVSDDPVRNTREEIIPRRLVMISTISARPFADIDRSKLNRPKVMEPNNGGAVPAGQSSKRSNKRIDE